MDANLALSTGKSSVAQPTPSGKRSKSSSNNKTSSTSKLASGKTSSNSAHQKTVQNNSNKTDKDRLKVSNSNLKSAKSSEDSALLSNTEPSVDLKTDKIVTPVLKETKVVEELETTTKIELRESKIKKRKTNSRTPTPITVPTDTVIPAANLSVLIPELSASVLSGINNSGSIIAEKHDTLISIESTEKIKKVCSLMNFKMFY